MTAHQEKKLDVAALLEFRDRFELPLSDEDVEQLRFMRPAEDSREMQIPARSDARALGGYLPARRAERARLSVPALESYAGFALRAEGKEMSTTMAAVRLLSNLLRDKTLGRAHRADRRRRGAHLRHGQSVPADRHLFAQRASCTSRRMPARCCPIANRATASCSRRASPRPARCPPGSRRRPPTACTACRMLPFYIFYSMFGFQRVGDLIWAAADQRARGFLLGATAGRTTLGGGGCSIRTARAT